MVEASVGDSTGKATPVRSKLQLVQCQMPNIIAIEKRDMELMRQVGSGSSLAEAADKVGMSGLNAARRLYEVKRRVRSAITRARHGQ